MMGWKIKLKTGDEWDVVFDPHLYCYLDKPGVKSEIKRQMRRRARRIAKQQIRKYDRTLSEL